jgi:hypothetical protein
MRRSSLLTRRSAFFATAGALDARWGPVLQEPLSF